jgi:hypothetical protein
MHKMKEKVILRILAQESPTSEFRLRRYGEKKLLGLFVIFGKWLGLNWNLFLKTRGLLEIFEDYGLISHKGKGLTAKSAGIFQRRFFSMGKYGALGPPSVDHGWRRSTVDCRQGLGGGSLELVLAAAPGRGGTMERAARGVHLGPHRAVGSGVATGRQW